MGFSIGCCLLISFKDKGVRTEMSRSILVGKGEGRGTKMGVRTVWCGRFLGGWHLRKSRVTRLGW